MNNLLIVQPYVPKYRSGLFARLRKVLADQGIAMRLAAGTPGREDLLRADATTDQVDYLLRQTSVRVASKEIRYRYLLGAIRDFRPDLLIAEQAVRNLETHQLLSHLGSRGACRVGLWGHGRTYGTKRASTANTRLKDRMTLRADWFFAYAPEGARYLEEVGFPSTRLTVVMNSIDTAALRADVDAVSAAEIGSFRRHYGLQTGRTGIFVGGVDSRKGIGFLLDAARQVEAKTQGFVLLIGGAGAQVDLVRAAEQSGLPVRYLGRLEGQEKAVALRASDIMMIPEWVGLVAVDSLTAGRPIVTTEHWSHCPEFEYLSPNRNSIVCDHDVRSYADAVSSILADSEGLSRLKASAYSEGRNLSIEGMADRFATGIVRWSRAGCRSRVPGH